MTRFTISRPRLALILWIVWAVITWNVVFDHVLEVAGRQYLHAAAVAAAAGGPYALIDDWMRPALTRGLWIASGTAGAIAVIGVVAVRLAAPRARRLSPDPTPGQASGSVNK